MARAFVALLFFVGHALGQGTIRTITFDETYLVGIGGPHFSLTWETTATVPPLDGRFALARDIVTIATGGANSLSAWIFIPSNPGRNQGTLSAVEFSVGGTFSYGNHVRIPMMDRLDQWVNVTATLPGPVDVMAVTAWDDTLPNPNFYPYFAMDNITLSSIPEPSPTALFGFGFGVLLLLKHKRRRDPASLVFGSLN